MTSMAGNSGGVEAGGQRASKPWPHVSRQQQAAVEAKYFEEGATVDFERLPGPPAVARLFRSGTGPQRTLVIMARVTSVARSAGRPLSQAEVDTLAEQGARAAGRLAWVLPVAVVGAGVLTWVDRKRYRFPFYTPPKNGWFDPRAFPTRRAPLVRGRNAGAVWHGVRFAAYLPLTWFGTGLFFASMIRTRFLADMADPRLEGLRADIQRQQIARGQKATGMPHPAHPADLENAEAWPEQDHVGEPSSSSRSSAAPAWPGAPPSSPAARQPAEAAAAPSAPWPSQRDSSAKEPQTPFDDTDLFEDDDDASPVPASVRRAERRQAAQLAQQQQQQELQRQARQPQTAGSSWSRVRQQAGVSGSPPAAATTGDDAPPRRRAPSAWSRVRQGGNASTSSDQAGGDDYPYGAAGDDDATSKSRAQKQFDDMLEAERQGGSDGGRGGKRGW